ncbi:hypothetical protein CRM22_008273 [Opisthorchis felineus]|uniref:Poly A polymerase head domain-containing protein n=1 Tax=Opisthorchis felineus TaxID=147828 RepID=A0A4S2LCL5_OPIFE|nr:hypothetical protein CRM22_008273 [Opisthorchis felineus]
MRLLHFIRWSSVVLITRKPSKFFKSINNHSSLFHLSSCCHTFTVGTKVLTMTSEESEKIDLTSFPSLYREENVILHKLFHKHGYELRIAGGAVRDVLLGITPKDIDYATDATPTEMNEMFLSENIRTLNRNGETHGTVTVRINDKINFEITTLRIDSEPDGRHTKVVFTDDWRLDAGRRDLTVNSMFLGLDLSTLPDNHVENTDPTDQQDTQGLDVQQPSSTLNSKAPQVFGRVYDFFGGRVDLSRRHIRFVGDATTRIQEDYLRILRYFRFHGRLANPDEQDIHDPDTLEAIRENADGLSKIAGERCWIEVKNILSYPSTPMLLRRMFDAGLFPHLGFPRDPNFTELDAAWQRGIINRTTCAATHLAALLTSAEEVETLNNRLKLSNAEVLILIYIVKHREECSRLTGLDALPHYQRELLLSREPPNKIRPILTEMLHYVGCDPELSASWALWEPPKFPVSGYEVQSKWSILPRVTGAFLTVLRRQWVESNCKLTSDDLLCDTNRSVTEAAVDMLNPEPPLSRKAKKARHH